MIRELDKKDAESDPKNWIKANPLLCRTKEGLKEFEDKYREVMGSKIPEKIREFRTKKLNKWISGGRGIPYMPEEYMDKWDQLAVSREAFAELVKGHSTVVGIDMSKKIDLTACDFIFALDDERVAIAAHGFLPEEGISRHEKTDKIPYRAWADEGWMTITEGDVTDSRRIEQHIEDYEMEADLSIYEIGYDPYQALSFSNTMQEKGYKLVEIRQTMQNLSEPTKLLREMVISGKIVHDGSPLLRSHIVNALQITDSKENIMITKKNASDTKRIDLLAAGITAMVRMPALREAGNNGDLSGLGF
jgi:phage terminase large subunit-like protein